ncbi:ethanolamine ammonia-lyase subunit EutC [Acidisoma cellulosilytica]|uniref:Ethanolamine ammonia-lyase small subunit n=1 Tax=Acidisoma cellulosilyticum TaxID=2802395 RepID=A0A963YYM3_9PROT|nr:ethanolamine ammonia-lyase subunit EutC [Acidisoma cellulosilyticum]MCB8878660.1 ethanolamine ammonia-lyase subunit EutC [Acidisoma cellulosilyticum]
MSIDRFEALRQFTAARIGLGRSGPGIATPDHLAFRAAHALARDAVHTELDLAALERSLVLLGLPVLRVESRAPDQQTYLTRPDFGRRLSDASATLLRDKAPGLEIAVLVAGGLSAFATASHAAELLALLAPALQRAGRTLGPICIAPRGRVALGDEVGALLGARLMLVLIGERPGLSSPDSLGAYITLAPRLGQTDADRNCISNIRPEGMLLTEAARRILWLTDQAMTRGISGVGLKDDSDRVLLTSEAAAASPALE